MARYPFPWRMFVQLCRAMLDGERSLANDAAAMVSRIQPAPVVAGSEHIPPTGALVVAANHYQRRGLWIAWPGAVITSEVARRRGVDPPVHWLVTGGLRWCQWRAAGPEVPGTALIFGRVARLYGMTPLSLSDPVARAGALHGWIERLRQGKAGGIFPEGLTGHSDGLRPPDRGFGPLCSLLSRQNVAVLPTGICEVEGTLHIRFGPILDGWTEGDAAGMEQCVMAAIAALLPPELRGPYGDPAAGRE